MLRFLPDGVLEGLLRPFLMADPSAYMYVELMAPDWRAAALFIALAIGALCGRIRGRIDARQLRLLVGFVVCLYVWTFVIGNGRYFFGWLLIVGPLLVLAVRWLPGSPAFRWLMLGVVALVQGLSLHGSYVANAWALARWVRGFGIDIEASPLQSQPAVFLTISSLSYSILIPRFDPGSRWADLNGPENIRPGSREYPRLKALLGSPLPKYVVLPVLSADGSLDAQPGGELKVLIARALRPFDIERTAGSCRILRSSLAPGPVEPNDKPVPNQGFWFCPVAVVPFAAGRALLPQPAGSDLADVFERIEQRCPRFFPPGGGNEVSSSEFTMRHYTGSDVRVYIENGSVSYRYTRALNPTWVGTIEQVRQGSFMIECSKLPGRYVLPWAVR
jgi:hypothetical protein